MGKVLVVDDERSMREFLAICLKRAGHGVRVAGTGDEALEELDRAAPGVVITTHAAANASMAWAWREFDRPRPIGPPTPAAARHPRS